MSFVRCLIRRFFECFFERVLSFYFVACSRKNQKKSVIVNEAKSKSCVNPTFTKKSKKTDDKASISNEIAK